MPDPQSNSAHSADSPAPQAYRDAANRVRSAARQRLLELRQARQRGKAASEKASETAAGTGTAPDTQETTELPAEMAELEGGEDFAASLTAASGEEAPVVSAPDSSVEEVAEEPLPPAPAAPKRSRKPAAKKARSRKTSQSSGKAKSSAKSATPDIAVEGAVGSKPEVGDPDVGPQADDAKSSEDTDAQVMAVSSAAAQVALDAQAVSATDMPEPADQPDTAPIPETSVPEPAVECDLDRLPGAGPGLIWLLNGLGIMSLEDLAAADATVLQDKLGLVGQLISFDSWITFAKTAQG